MFALTKAQVILALALSLHSVRAFEPTFSTPRQCEPLSISWSSIDLPTSIALTEITMTLIPLDGNPAHFAPEPYTLAVPCDGAASAGSVSIPSLPFPAGTDFFAQAYIPGMSGPTKRTVSNVMKVAHSANSNCLPVHPDLDKRKVKQFGKRQINVIGSNTLASADLPAAAPATTPSANTPINVVGVGQVPANGASDPAAAPSSASASSSGAVPAIGVIGTQVVSASPVAGTDAPVNAVPPPSASSSGPVPPVVVVGTSFVDATPAPGSGSDSSVAPAPTDSASFVPNFSTGQASQQDATTSCTSTWSTETAQAEATSTDCTTTWSTETAQAQATSTDCTTTEAAQAAETQAASYDSSYNNSYDNSYNSSADSQDSETTTSCTDGVSPTEGSDSSFQSSDTSMPSPTQGYNGDSNASSYGSFDDMVNAANNMFHAWNPYKPAYTPST